MTLSPSIRRKLTVLVTFFAGQGATQALNLLSGFLVLHWLDVISYGQYGLTFGFQSTANMLIDLGFSSTIVALVGHRVDDRAVLGNYIRSGRSLRSRMLLIVTPISTLFYFYLTHQLRWSFVTRGLLLASIFVSIYFSGMQAYYTAPLIVQRKLWTHYRIQALIAIFRVASYVLLHKVGVLNAVSAVWINAIGIIIAGIAYKSASRTFLEEPTQPNPLITKQMLVYVLPNLPGVIFFALQGQISVFLIAALGHNKAIAQVAALSRIGQIFTLIAALNGTILEPWFAKSPQKSVLRRYLIAAGITIIFSLAFVMVSVVFPGGLLWILGKHYTDLRQEVRWTVLTGCTSYLAALTWTVISGRRFIYWSSTFLNIALILVAQLCFLLFIGVTTTLQAVEFGFASVIASLIAQIINLGYGLRRGPRVDLIATDGLKVEELNEI
jgi:O-antigen/teichoic acid export membrane protein